MPASPSCSVRSRLSSWSRGLSLGAIRYWMLGRSKLATKCLASPSCSRCAISACVCVGGGGGQRDPRDLGPALVQHRQLQVVGPEVVPPLGHAVRLVDGEQGDGAAVQQLDGLPHAQPLGRQVEQVELAGEVGVLDLAPLERLLRRVEEPGAHAERGQRVDLVLHEGDQRRDDDAGALPDQRGHLVAERLAAAGGHEHERVAAADDGVDDLGLLAAEGVVPPDAVQHLGRRGQRGLGVERPAATSRGMSGRGGGRAAGRADAARRSGGAAS